MGVILPDYPFHKYKHHPWSYAVVIATTKR
jgi:hypothetical protein